MRWKHFGWWVSDGWKDGALIFFLAAANLNVHSAVCSILQYLAAAASHYTSNLNIHSAIVLCCSSVTYSLKLHFFPAAASTYLCFTLLCFQYFLCFTLPFNLAIFHTLPPSRRLLPTLCLDSHFSLQLEIVHTPQISNLHSSRTQQF